MNKKGKNQPDDFDILGKLNIGNAMDVDLNDPALMKELKGMGWDDDEDMDIDPELADLEKQIEEEEDFVVPQGREMTAEEIENAKFDEDDLNDPDLEAELDEAEGRENDPVLQASLRIEHLEKEIELAKSNALREKANNNKEKALEYLKAMKSYEAELNSAKQLLSMHKITQKERKKKDTDPPEDFDFSSIVSMSVLEYEKEQALKGKRNEVVETCDMQIDILTNNINLGIVSQEQYIENLQIKIKEYEGFCKGPNKGFFLKHVQLMNQELQEAAEAGEEEEEEEEFEEEAGKVVRQPSVKKPLQPVPVDPVPKPKVEDDHEELMKNIKYRTVFESFDEGKLAFQYLKNIGQTSLAEKILDRLESWQKILQAIKSGKEFKSEIKPLSPIDLIGVTEESRRQKFAELIKFTIEQAAKSKEKALAALKQKDKDQAAIYKREMMSYEQKGQIMEQAMKNPWQAPPNVTVRSIVKSVPVIHEDLEACALEVTYGSASGFSDSEDYFITYSMVAGDTLSGSTDRFSKVSSKGINHTFLIKVDQRNFSSLFKKHIIFEVFEYHRIRSNKSQGTCNLKLEQLAKQSTWTTNIQLARKGPSIVVTFRVQKSLVSAEMKQITENLEVVEDLITPFKSFDGLILQKKEEVVQSSPKVNPNPSQTAPKAPEESKQESGNFEDIGQDEYDNPNVARNLVSFEVLELEIERLKGVIIELRSNGKSADGFMNLQRELMRNKSIIEAQVGNGVITPEQYKEVLEKQVEHDTKLASFYKQRGKKQHLETVLNRVRIMKKEIVELANADE